VDPTHCPRAISASPESGKNRKRKGKCAIRSTCGDGQAASRGQSGSAADAENPGRPDRSI
ncbi:MAG: hypothetical protein, partial [Olavius algarvensis Delta 4 endosymbiont]